MKRPGRERPLRLAPKIVLYIMFLYSGFPLSCSVNSILGVHRAPGPGASLPWVARLLCRRG